jgi:amino acid adenylation domain-containing protein
MTELHDRLAALSPAKRALLARLGAPPAGPAPIPRVADGPAPLSPEQRRLWYLLQLAPGYPVYTIALGWRLRGPLDVDALLGALRDLAARHEPLRTTFRESAGEPVQEVGDGAGFAPEVADLRGDPWGGAEARYLTDAFARHVYDLERGPLFRALLLRTADDEARLLLGMHHLLFDGGSRGVLLRELSALYAARLAGEAAPLPEPAVRFRDWAAWRGRPDPAERAGDEAYWRGELAGAPAALELPVDRPRPPAQEWDGAKHPFGVPAALAAQVRALARGAGSTPYVVLAAAFGLLLGRYADRDDLLLGSVASLRARPELEGMVGFLANTLPLRVRLEGDPTVAGLLRRVHRAAAGMQAHAGLPFDRVVELAGVRRDFRRPPLLQAVLGFSESADGALALPGVAAEPLPLDSRTSVFDLSLMVEDEGDGFAAFFQYATGLFEAATVERMARRLETVLAAFAADPERPVSRVPLAPEGELREVLAWGTAEPPPPDDLPAHRLFERQARATPDAPAVLETGRTTSYAELAARAAAVAAALRRAGVRPEARVGVCVEPSADLVAAVLGVLGAGGAFVPLDPAYPAERLRWMLEDAEVATVVVHARTRGALPEYGGEVIVIDTPHPPAPSPTRGEGEHDDAADTSAAAVAGCSLFPVPCSLAYVIYTSGSTGRPKGVAVEHGSLAGTLLAAREAFGLAPGDVMPAMASASFDVWLLEALLPLVCGAAVRPVPRERVLDLPRLVAEELADATALHAVPVLMREIVREAGALPRLRRALVGGDAVPPALLAEMRAAFPAAEIRVLYGPTEAAIVCASHRVDDEPAGRPIGRPLPGARLHVLGADGAPVPQGVPGELCVGGPGVARGYLGRPERTAERFVPDPFSGGAGARLYRTGDRARWGADGALEFLGRLDRQVKVRGFRVEPGEAEAALAAHPGVREAAVAAREDAPGETRLAGYVVPEGGEVDAAELRAWLRARLPAHLVPEALVVLDALPLTPSGKPDRAALPAPGGGGGDGYVAPRTPEEEALARIWADVLGVERVGVRDDFFELGGQSILATRLLARVRAELDADATVAALLAGATVEEMARAVAGRRSPTRPPLVALQTFGERAPLFLVHPAGGHVVCYRALAVHLAPEQPVYALQPRGVDGGEAPLADLAEMAAHYVDAVRAFRPEGPYRLGGWSFGGVVAWEMARQLAAAGAEPELLALVDTAPLGAEGDSADRRDPAEVVWHTVAGVAGWAAASRVDVGRLRGMEPREAVLEMVRGMDAPHLLGESRVDEVLALIAVRAANARAQEGYRTGRYPGRLTYFRTVGSDHADAHAPGLAFWSALADGGTTAHAVTGSHGSILQEPHVAAVAAALLAPG